MVYVYMYYVLVGHCLATNIFCGQIAGMQHPGFCPHWSEVVGPNQNALSNFYHHSSRFYHHSQVQNAFWQKA